MRNWMYIHTNQPIFCKACLDAKLYVYGRLGRTWLSTPDHIYEMTVLKNNLTNKIHGWAMLFVGVKQHEDLPIFSSFLQFGVYVQPEYRKLGIGTKLSRILIDKCPYNFEYDLLLSDMMYELNYFHNRKHFINSPKEPFLYELP